MIALEVAIQHIIQRIKRFADDANINTNIHINNFKELKINKKSLL